MSPRCRFLRCRMAAQGRVRIYRLDGGGPKEKGSYRCDECSWEAHGVARTAANHHTERRHEGRGAQLSRCVPQSSGGRRLSQDPAAVRNRERMRRERGEGKVRVLGPGRCWVVCCGGSVGGRDGGELAVAVRQWLHLSCR